MSVSEPILRTGADDLVRITVSQIGGAVILSLDGDVCVASAPAVRTALEAAIAADSSGEVIVDLRATTLLAAAGVTELLRAHRALEVRGGSLRVTGALPIAARTLEVCGVAALIESPADRERRRLAEVRERTEQQRAAALLRQVELAEVRARAASRREQLRAQRER